MNTRVKSIVLFIVCMVFSFNTKLFAWEDISKVVIDYENWVDISVTIRDQHYGPVVVSGQTKVFGASFTNGTGASKICDFRYAAFKEGKIVQIYDGTGEVMLENGAMHDIKVSCYINLPEGDYIFFPIVRFKGETNWNMMRHMSSIEKNGYWKLHVYENYPAPSSEYMNFPDANGKGDSEYSVYNYYKNEKFSVQMKLVNKSSSPMNGKIKIMWERNLAKFWRGMKYSAGDVTTEWSICASNLAHIGLTKAENGGIPITISANSKLDVMIEDCFLSDYFDIQQRWTPYMVAYFLPDGKEDIESNWLIVNDNADFCFDSNKVLVTEGWDHALNYLPVMTFNEDVTGLETIEVDKIGLKFDKSSGLVSLSNVAESSFVRVVDINGRLVQTNSIEGSKSFSFNLKPGSGLNIVRLYNYDGKLVKSFKIIR